MAAQCQTSCACCPSGGQPSPPSTSNLISKSNFPTNTILLLIIRINDAGKFPYGSGTSIHTTALFSSSRIFSPSIRNFQVNFFSPPKTQHKVMKRNLQFVVRKTSLARHHLTGLKLGRSSRLLRTTF